MPADAPHRPHPRESAQRCALRAQLRGDPMLGTAFPAARVLLVEQPGPWGPAGLTESRFPAGPARRLERLADAAGVRVLAIRRPGRTPPGRSRRWLLADTRDGRRRLSGGSYRDAGELLDLDLAADPGDPVAGPLHLVCTHSRHDACCALRGRPVAAALHVLRPERVWECSHVGGERFAANVLVLPFGLLYGRVLPFAAAEFVAAADAGEVVGALLRGRVGLPPAAQAALAHGYESLALRDEGALRVLATSPAQDGRVRVELAGPRGRLLVTIRLDRCRVQGLTCSAPGRGSYLAYRPESIELLD